jgi:hypothetical protein
MQAITVLPRNGLLMLVVPIFSLFSFVVMLSEG